MIILPSDVVNEMLKEFCDQDTLCNTRELQSPRVRRCTRFKKMKKAIESGNLENAKWIAHQNDEWKLCDGRYCLKVAAEDGPLDCLKWLLHALGCSVTNVDGCIVMQ